MESPRPTNPMKGRYEVKEVGNKNPIPKENRRRSEGMNIQKRSCPSIPSGRKRNAILSAIEDVLFTEKAAVTSQTLLVSEDT